MLSHLPNSLIMSGETPSASAAEALDVPLVRTHPNGVGELLLLPNLVSRKGSLVQPCTTRGPLATIYVVISSDGQELASTRTHGHITPHVHTQSTLYTCISTHKYVYSKYRVYSIRAKLGHNRGIICNLQSTAIISATG